MADTYETHAKGIRIVPGQWRPHYPWEHIAWVSPSWPSQDYIWLDFPEAVFTDQGLLYLSHVNPPIPTVHGPLEPVPWESVPGGIAFTRTLPDGVRFESRVEQAGSGRVELIFTLYNGSGGPLTRISLQTCAFLRAIREFAEYTAANKFVHTTAKGWLPYPDAQALPPDDSRYRAGWRWSGNAVADRPVMAVRSSVAERYLAMTWFKHTLSLVTNPRHPCLHADPWLPDLEPGASATVRGCLAFHEGPLEELPVGP